MIKFSFNEPVSKDYKNRVLNAVKPELEINKKNSSSGRSWKLALGSSFSALLIATLFYFQVYNPSYKNSDLNASISSNLLMEISALSPTEVEVVKELEFMNALDKLSPEELEEVLL